MKVKASNACGESDFSDSLKITVKATPATPEKPQGETGICEKGISTYIVAAPEYTNSFVWKISPPQAGQISGINAQVTTEWNEYIGDAFIKASAENDCGASKFSDSLKVNLSKPTVSEIIKKSETMILTTDSGFVYQWYKDDIAIQGATKQYLNDINLPTGNYQVEITDANGCKDKSDIFEFNSNKSGGLDKSVFVYPNPAKDRVYIKIDNPITGKGKIIISDVFGKQLSITDFNKETQKEEYYEDISNLPPGNYLIDIIFDSGEKASKKLMVE